MNKDRGTTRGRGPDVIWLPCLYYRTHNRLFLIINLMNVCPRTQRKPGSLSLLRGAIKWVVVWNLIDCWIVKEHKEPTKILYTWWLPGICRSLMIQPGYDVRPRPTEWSSCTFPLVPGWMTMTRLGAALVGWSCLNKTATSSAGETRTSSSVAASQPLSVAKWQFTWPVENGSENKKSHRKDTKRSAQLIAKILLLHHHHHDRHRSLFGPFKSIDISDLTAE